MFPSRVFWMAGFKQFACFAKARSARHPVAARDATAREAKHPSSAGRGEHMQRQPADARSREPPNYLRERGVSLIADRSATPREPRRINLDAG